ncbi:anti-sigma factor family protein [Streptomyces halobius]|uniref:Zf-HC2 domain-containing protein n=1 Tax=Streptomyces halobius TaxID=2879846 RepID=A0ABY4MIJ3_9ACTN|nr:zf-HC2 domain-containing protein [Streptomyces halobius]UQA97067.1 zf-HC2 domain-containing protein [Streptomyces halobius]
MRKPYLPRLREIWDECRERARHLRLHGDLGAYADGELSGNRRVRMAAHLACCWICSGRLETLQLIKASIRRSPHRAPVSLAEVRIRQYADRLTHSPPSS